MYGENKWKFGGITNGWVRWMKKSPNSGAPYLGVTTARSLGGAGAGAARRGTAYRVRRTRPKLNENLLVRVSLLFYLLEDNFLY